MSSYECGECGESFTIDIEPNVCPNCGRADAVTERHPGALSDRTDILFPRRDVRRRLDQIAHSGAHLTGVAFTSAGPNPSPSGSRRRTQLYLAVGDDRLERDGEFLVVREPNAGKSRLASLSELVNVLIQPEWFRDE